jgi:hypothetical protein
MASKQAKLASWLRERAPGQVVLTDFDELLLLLAPITESDLRHRLRLTGADLHPLVGGVNQDTLAALRDSLLGLATWYQNGTAETRRLTRRIVITAKDHAKLAARNRRVTPEKRALKGEMAVWMLTWLENPLIFALWVPLREKLLTEINHEK